MTTTTPQNVLARLQAAWLTPSLSVVDRAGSTEAEAEPAIIAYCGPHNDPAKWEYSPDNYSRDGTRAVHCNRCGRFIGYQTLREQNHNRRQPDARQLGR